MMITALCIMAFPARLQAVVLLCSGLVRLLSLVPGFGAGVWGALGCASQGCTMRDALIMRSCAHQRIMRLLLAVNALP